MKKFLGILAVLGLFLGNSACTVDSSSSDNLLSLMNTASSSGVSLSGSYTESSSGLSAETTTSYSSSSTVDTSTYSKVLYVNLSEGKWSNDNSTFTDLNVGGDAASVFTDGLVTVKYTKNSGESTGLVKIDAQSATYDLAVYLSGTATKGGVKIQSNGSNKIAVYLNNATITSSSYPCLEITKGSPAIVNLSGTNTFADGRAYGTGYGAYYTTDSSLAGTTNSDGDTYIYCGSGSVVEEGSDSKGSLYCKSNLTINGSGSLTIKQAYKNCIATKTALVIDGGTFTLTSDGKNGILGDESVTINDGTIKFTGTGAIATSGTTKFRKANGIKTDGDTSSSKVTINGGTISLSATTGKGINSNYVYVNGGSLDIVSSGTAYSSDAGTGGFGGHPGSSSSSSSTISYYDADGVAASDTLKFAPEGIEGQYLIQVTGGSVSVNAGDDGFNASASSGSVKISGGNVYVYAGGDALDSNGTIQITGGVIIPITLGNGENAIDADGQITISGGTLAGFDKGGMSVSYSLKQVLATLSSSYAGSAGNNMAIKDSSGNVVYACTLPSAASGFSEMFASNGNMSNGTSYTIYTGCTFSGGTNFKGLYSSMPSVSGGSSKGSFTPSSYKASK